MTKATLSMPSQSTRTLGALRMNGTTPFRLWAPERMTVELVVRAKARL